MMVCTAPRWRALFVLVLLGLTSPAIAGNEPPGPEAPAKVRLEWVVEAASAIPRRGILKLQPLSTSAAGLPKPRSIRIDGDAPAVADLPAGSRWALSIEMPGYWARRESLEAGLAGTESSHAIALWPTGTIAGAVRMANPREKPPKRVVVEPLVSPLAARQSDPAGEARVCPVDAMHRFSCELPAHVFDLSLSADGYIPRYRWATEIVAGKRLDVGSIELVRGASVAGWALAEEGTLSPGRCTARLIPLVAPGGGRLGLRIEETAGTATVRKDGFFQLRGVAPGNYLLQVEQPGFAAARAFPIEVWPGAETLVKQPLVLRRPLTLELAIAPPVDWLGKPWRVHVVRFSDFSANLERQPAYDGTASREGRVAVPGQSAGRYLLNVYDSLGNSLFANPQLEVTGPADARREIAIDLITVDGRLTLGSEPLAATIWFGSPRSAPGVKMSADDKGRFQGVLPRAGRWEVDIESGEPELHTIRSTQVRPDRAGRAKVEIALPNVRVFGRVVDEEGKPAAGAQVGMNMEGASDLVRTDATGAFSSRGLAEGPLVLVANASSPQGKSVSDPATVFLKDGQESGPIELHLRRMRTVAGKVVSPPGPAVGALVAAVPSGMEQFPVEEARTDLDGSFTLQVPTGAQSAFFYVSAPGDAFRAFAVQLDGSTVTLAVEADAGTLEVAVPYSRAEIDEQDLSPPWFLQNGIPVPAAFLRSWSLGHGEPYADPAYTRLRIGNLAPGNYQVCFASRSRVVHAHRTGWANPPGSCASGSLAAGATLRLAPPHANADLRGTSFSDVK
jgi:hypothetical protein